MHFLKYLIRKFIKAIFYLVYILPYKGRYFVGFCIGVLWFDILRIRRKIIFQNLDKAFPDKSKKQKTQIARASCVNLGMTYVEFMCMRFLNKSHLSEFKVYGEEHLIRAREKGKGVCLLTLHLGNGDYACAGFAMMGNPLVLISKEFKVKWLNDVWFNMRKRFGMTFIKPRRSSYDILKSLKAKKTVIFVMDQFMGPPIGVETTFFGHPTGSAMGLAVMAQRASSPVVPIYTRRTKLGITEIHFFPEIPFIEKESKDATIAYMTQAYQDKLEEFVREHPDQWMWVHRRFKPFIREPKKLPPQKV